MQRIRYFHLDKEGTEMDLRTEVLQELHSQEPLTALTKVLERAAGQEQLHSLHLPPVSTAERGPIVSNPAGPRRRRQRQLDRRQCLLVFGWAGMSKRDGHDSTCTYPFPVAATT